MPIILFILFSTALFASVCGPQEIYVREQWIESYKRADGTKVSAHLRKGHCRELTQFNYYQDSTTQSFKKIKTNIKKWKPEEKKIVDEYLSKLLNGSKSTNLESSLEVMWEEMLTIPQQEYLLREHSLFLISFLKLRTNLTCLFMKLAI